MINKSVAINNRKKIFYTLIMLFSTFLIFSYTNILSSGKILYLGSNFYYITITIIQVSLLYVIIKSKKIGNLDIFVVLFFCISMMLLFYVVPGLFPMGLDSIFSIKSVDFLINNGFSTAFLTNSFPLTATYSLPGLSILTANFVLITGSSYILASKYTAFFIGVISITFIYLFINKFLNKKTALLSLLILISFPFINDLGSAFSNSLLGFLLFIMFIYTVNRNYNNIMAITIIQIIILTFLAFSHHLSAVILIATLVLIQFYYYFSKKYSNNKDLPSLTNLIILSAVLIFGYYCFMYFAPIEIIVKTFTGQLIAEGQQGVTVPLISWSLPIILQRLSWIFTIIFTLLLVIKLINKNSFKSYLITNNALFLFIGGSLFIFAVVSTVMHSPFGWDRINEFGWLFLIPAGVFLYQNLSNKSKLMKVVPILIVGFLIFANIYSNSPNIYDHSGDNEYSGDYKDWMTAQEYDSVNWMITNNNLNGNIMGDAEVMRIYLSNSNVLTKILSDKSSDGLQLSSGNYNNIMQSQFKYLIIRKENFYHILWGNDKINNSTYGEISNNLNQIYDNGEVFTFTR
jgi:hypothetical protein